MTHFLHTHLVRRRAASVVSIVAMVLTLLTAVGAQQAAAASSCHPYPDVSSSNPHCSNVSWLKGQSITKPSDGKYHPRDGVTRGSMAAFLFRLVNPGKPSPKCTSKPFPDVKTSNVFCGYIKWAATTGVTKGYPDGKFRPSNGVTRGAMAAFLQRIANPGHPAKKCTTKPFKDIAVSDTFCGVVTWMVTNGITYGVGDGTKYGSAMLVNRQSMASFLHRIFTTQGVLTQAAPPEWSPTGKTETFKGVSFRHSKNWHTERASDGIGMTSPKDEQGNQCYIYVLEPRPAAATENGRIQQALDAAVYVSEVPAGTFTNQAGQHKPMSDAFRGSTGNGWDYTGLDLRLTLEGTTFYMMSMTARFGNKAVPLVVFEKESPFGTDCVEDNGKFSVEFAKVFYSLSMGTAKPNNSLAGKVPGDYFHSSGSTGNAYTFGQNGQYDHVAITGGYVWLPSGNWRDEYATWTGTGSWAASGDLLAFFPYGRSAYSDYSRVFEFKNSSGHWTKNLCFMSDYKGSPYSYCVQQT